MNGNMIFGRSPLGQRNKLNLKALLPVLGLSIAMAGGQANAETLMIVSEDKSVQLTGKLILIDAEKFVIRSGFDMIEFDATSVTCVDSVCTIKGS